MKVTKLIAVAVLLFVLAQGQAFALPIDFEVLTGPVLLRSTGSEIVFGSLPENIEWAELTLTYVSLPRLRWDVTTEGGQVIGSFSGVGQQEWMLPQAVLDEADNHLLLSVTLGNGVASRLPQGIIVYGKLGGQYESAPIPEPATFLLFGSGLCAMGMFVRRLSTKK